MNAESIQTEMMWTVFLLLMLTSPCSSAAVADLEPEFLERNMNFTVAEGEDVELPCVVENLGSYKVAWIRVESQTVLTIHTHVITRNYRITLNYKDHQQWNLHIKSVQEEDRGRYMCQINTVPMRKQIGYLDVVVPPKFIQADRNTESLAREGSNATLSCKVKGHPVPIVTWQREDGQSFSTGNFQSRNQRNSYEGEELVIDKVSRLHMGTYLCTAKNNVPPAVTRRTVLYVHFPPMIWIPNQLIGVSVGQSVILECLVEAFPKSINYWTRVDGHLVVTGDKFAVTIQENTYKMHMKLTILTVQTEDFGNYFCSAKNSIGSTEGVIRLYETVDIHRTSTAKTDLIDGDGNSSQKSLHIGFRNRKTDDRLEMLDDSLSRERHFPNQPTVEGVDKVEGPTNGNPQRLCVMKSAALLLAVALFQQVAGSLS